MVNTAFYVETLFLKSLFVKFECFELGKSRLEKGNNSEILFTVFIYFRRLNPLSKSISQTNDFRFIFSLLRDVSLV